MSEPFVRPAPDPPDGAFPPGPSSLRELGWRPQPMVRWFDPVQLQSTALRAMLSAVFGAYADRREMQAALSRDGGSPVIHAYDDQEEVWIDYVADLGDGFDSTYTVAWLLGQPGLPCEEGEPLGETRRGRILLMGGDQVYPTASRQEYERRLAGPYAAALPWHEEGSRPRLFAIPGNHDWYDGLTAFLRQFCQQRWIGGWRTRQSRSYFALRLPHRWWLLGLDVQLASDIDQPQLQYFEEVAAQMRPGDRVVLCTAQPAWVHARESPEAYHNLAFFERTVLCPRGARLVLTLTGDLHHYARYSDSTGERHKVTAGGGGAYLYGTHRLPEAVELPRVDETEAGAGEQPGTTTYRRECVYPDAATSRRLRLGAWRLPLRNRRFALLLGLVYAFYAWLLHGASLRLPDPEAGGFLERVRALPLPDAGAVLELYLASTLRSPALLALSAVILFALYRFCHPDVGRPRALRAIGLLHGAAHLLLALGLTWGLARLLLGTLGLQTATVAQLLLFAAAFTTCMVVLGGLLGGLLMGLALLPGVNFNEAYSCQGIEDYKSFLRMRLDASGLTLYPVGVDRVVRWRFVENQQPCEPYFEPAGERLPRVRLIEEPIHIPGPAAERVLAHRVVGDAREEAR